MGEIPLSFSSSEAQGTGHSSWQSRQGWKSSRIALGTEERCQFLPCLHVPASLIYHEDQDGVKEKSRISRHDFPLPLSPSPVIHIGTPSQFQHSTSEWHTKD